MYMCASVLYIGGGGEGVIQFICSLQKILVAHTSFCWAQ